MLFLNILSLVYTTANYKIYSMYNKLKDETLIYVDIQDIFAYNLKITAVNPKSKTFIQFKNENVENFIKNNYSDLINHPDLMYSEKKYKYGLFAIINSDLIMNNTLEVHFNLFNDEFTLNLHMNQNTSLNLLYKSFRLYTEYFDELSIKFNLICSKINKIYYNCHKIKQGISYDHFIYLKTMISSIICEVRSWKIKIKYKHEVIEEIRELVNISTSDDSYDVNQEKIVELLKITTETYRECLKNYKYIINYLRNSNLTLYYDNIMLIEYENESSIQEEDYLINNTCIITSNNSKAIPEALNIPKIIVTDKEANSIILNEDDESSTETDKEKSELKHCENESFIEKNNEDSN